MRFFVSFLFCFISIFNKNNVSNQKNNCAYIYKNNEKKEISISSYHELINKESNNFYYEDIKNKKDEISYSKNNIITFTKNYIILDETITMDEYFEYINVIGLEKNEYDIVYFSYQTNYYPGKIPISIQIKNIKENKLLEKIYFTIPVYFISYSNYNEITRFKIPYSIPKFFIDYIYLYIKDENLINIYEYEYLYENNNSINIPKIIYKLNTSNTYKIIIFDIYDDVLPVIITNNIYTTTIKKLKYDDLINLIDAYDDYSDIHIKLYDLDNYLNNTSIKGEYKIKVEVTDEYNNKTEKIVIINNILESYKYIYLEDIIVSDKNVDPYEMIIYGYKNLINGYSIKLIDKYDNKKTYLVYNNDQNYILSLVYKNNNDIIKENNVKNYIYFITPLILYAVINIVIYKKV